MRKATATLPTLLAVLSVLLIFGLSAAGAAEDKEGAGDPHGLGVDGEWVTNGRANDLQEYCDTHVKGSLCAEWCEGFDGRPSGDYCCVPPTAVGYPGNYSDCIEAPQ